MKKILLISLSIIASYYVQAQTQDKKWNIGLHAGVGQYKGDLGNDFYKTDMPLYGFGGITFSRYIGGHLDLNLLATKGTFGYNRPNGRFRRDVSTV